MEGTGIVLERDLRELRQSNAFRIVMIFAAAVVIGAAVAISLVLGRQTWLAEPSARPLLVTVISAVAYFLPFAVLMTFIWVFASLPIIKEKVSGNIDSLLATPLTPRSIWMAKCLAIFIPGFIISILGTAVVWLAVNLAAIVPATGEFILPVPALISGLLISPALFFGLLAFIVLYSLANNPDVAIAPSFLLGFGLIIGLPLGMLTGFIDLSAWGFTLWYLVGTIAVWAVIGWLSRMLTREYIVLSSKGE